MIAVIIHWERAAWAYKYKEAIRKIQKWHTFGMKSYGCTRLLVVDVDKTIPLWSDSEMEVTNHDSLSNALAELKGYKQVYVEYGVLKAIPLSKYKHPQKAVYIFGSDYGAILKPGKADCIEIEQSGEYAYMWAAQCIPIVLRDRFFKEK